MEYVMGELETRKFAGIDLGKYAVQLSVYDEAAEHGYVPAMCWMGYYCMGNAVTMPKDERKALGWYLRAAEAGSEEACFRLGLIYEHGLGVEPDQEKALEWYRRGRIPWWAEDVKKKLESGE